MKNIIKKTALFLAELGFPFTFLSALWLKFVRKAKIGRINDKIFSATGLLPISDHYYEPLVNPKKHLTKSLREDRNLPGIDLNIKEQLELLNNFDYNNELEKFSIQKSNELEFYYRNKSFESGDAEYLYNMIRFYKPNRLIEIGSGFSTLMAQHAIAKNSTIDANYSCAHICIEPYEMPWLSQLNVQLKREVVENIDQTLFKSLEANDILFIDSSHIIRPQGDVLYEILEILPVLKSGVIVHFHDIFSPKDYLDDWIYKEHRLWNEQYLLEAFLSFNKEFRIIGALNYLTHNHQETINRKCPVLAIQDNREPGSFWIIKN